MQSGLFCNAFGTLCVITALGVHIACLVTPHYSQTDYSKIEGIVKDRNLSQVLSPRELDILHKLKWKVDVHWGLWQACFEYIGNGCETWYGYCAKDDLYLDPGYWLRAARSLSILGAVFLAKCAVGTVLTLIAESRGDRQKYLPLIICGFSFVGGLFSFLGDVVIAASYSSRYNIGRRYVFSDVAKDVIIETFSLSWSFYLDLLVPILSSVCGVCHLMGRRCYGTGSSCDKVKDANCYVPSVFDSDFGDTKKMKLDFY